jgi:hypothetical protein
MCLLREEAMAVNAPLYQYGIFGNDAGLAIAFLLGIAFGFFLERGGLGSARKLTAQFYFTDMSVFKVMFTAIVTAMIGLFWLSWIGFLDLARVHVLPTYIVPQIAGGLIFGVGFVAGGYCPGTSCVATFTGRIDGGIHLLGMMAGVLLFGEMFPLLEAFYNSSPLGQITFPDLLGVSTNVLVFVIVLLALAGFLFAGKIEHRKNETRSAI